MPANEFLNLEGNKISTSKNWAVWLHEYLQDFPDKQDVLRYVLTANAPESKDNDFTWKDFQARNNNELVAILGNFINRVTVLTHKYYDGIVPEKGKHFKELARISEFRDSIGKSIELFRFREASQELMNLARMGNVFLQEQEPWKKIKENPDEVKGILFVVLQIAASIAHLSEPFLPFSAKKLRNILNIDLKNWDDVVLSETESLIKNGHQINASELLFEKIENDAIQLQLDKLTARKILNEQENKVLNTQKDEITFDDFTNMDVRIGTILQAEKMPKTKKLLKLQVDVGIDTRTIVSGIAESFSPDNIIGQQVCVLINLAPRKIRGIESQGMILMAETKDGKLSFLAPVSDSIKNGEQVN